MTATCRRCGAIVTSDGIRNDLDLVRKMDAHVCELPQLDPEDPRTGCGRCSHSTITGDWANCGGCDDCAYFHGDGPNEAMGLSMLDVLALCIPWTAANCELCGHVWPTGCHLTEGLTHWGAFHLDYAEDDASGHYTVDFTPPAAVLENSEPF